MTIHTHDSETPAHGQQVITARAFIHYEFGGVTKVFLAKRADTKKFLPGTWELLGGHINFGENIVKGLKREIREELEVDINMGDPFAVFDYTNQVKCSHSIEVVYFATLLHAPENIKLHSEDHSDGDWFAKEDLYRIVDTKSGVDDPEFRAMQKAFALLNGISHDFAT